MLIPQTMNREKIVAGTPDAGKSNTKLINENMDKKKRLAGNSNVSGILLSSIIAYF